MSNIQNTQKLLTLFQKSGNRAIMSYLLGDLILSDIVFEKNIKKMLCVYFCEHMGMGLMVKDSEIILSDKIIYYG